MNQSSNAGLITLTVTGTVDMLTAPLLTEAVLQVLTEHPAGLILDLTKVDFLGSAGMTVLVASHQLITPTARFGIVATGPHTARPLQLVGLDQVLSIYSTLDHAVAALSEE